MDLNEIENAQDFRRLVIKRKVSLDVTDLLLIAIINFAVGAFVGAAIVLI